jgi:hypothetical protein
MPALSPEAWAHIRHDYEHSDRPVAAICAEYRISPGTLRDRMHRWNWTRRRPPVARQDLAPMAAYRDVAATSPLPACGERSASEASRVRGHHYDPGPVETPPHPDPLPACGERENRAGAVPGVDADPAAIVPRLQSAVARVLPAIEATLARLAAGPQAPREMEQAARALNTMMRTLRELNRCSPPAKRAPRARRSTTSPSAWTSTNCARSWRSASKPSWRRAGIRKTRSTTRSRMGRPISRHARPCAGHPRL